MKRTILLTMLFVALATANLSANNGRSPLTATFTVGNPSLQSLNALAFGPEGILFVGDSKSAKITAIDTKDNVAAEAPKSVKMASVDEQIATLLGTTTTEITIQDMAVNPISKMIYFAVHHSDGTPVLLKTDGETLQHVSLQAINHSTIELNNPIDAEKKDRRGNSMRVSAISDLNYFDGQVMVSGLSNEEFASTFRSIPFPFEATQTQTSLEIYHAAHGKYETHAPIKAFLPINISGKANLIAAYTCTPLVVFPMDNLKAGQHTKGQTVAELGNWNVPLDIIKMEKDGKSYLLMANSSRALMKISVADVANFGRSLSERVAQKSGTAGVDFINLPFVNVQQLDKLSDSQFIMLQRKANGDLDLYTQNNRWL
ncbi:MAG: hypothetical protein AAGJ18_23845 [Bacteroidota bacterium]